DLMSADYASDEDIPYYRTNISNRSADDTHYLPEPTDNSAAGIASLDHQIEELGLPDDLRELAVFVAASLDSNGYLTRSPLALADDLAMNLGIEVTPQQVETAIKTIRSLDPAGIGAENLRDCLMLQLNRMERSQAVEDATNIIDKEFYHFANRKYKKVRADLNIDEARLDEAVKVIHTLNPKPATMLESGDDDRMRYISPDFIIDTDDDGNVNVSMADRLPELIIEENFRRRSTDPATEAFIKARRSEAEEFISLAQRRYNTLMAVMKAIVKLQPEFFKTYDRSSLRPMVLRQIADATNINLSVVSRATAGKYALTPHGMVALKSLFSESISDTADISVYKIESALRKLIDDEDKAEPLSDDALAASLAQQNINIARRTVAKYRERMGISPARLRKIE
ncbi:MAG: RNA polymerase factor sigma-54, partial [Muribaculaceae bacterium]|nr:RNA polymerase factor sigma-54 [Muribaculaceae bacterium]